MPQKEVNHETEEMGNAVKNGLLALYAMLLFAVLDGADFVQVGCPNVQHHIYI